MEILQLVPMGGQVGNQIDTYFHKRCFFLIEIDKNVDFLGHPSSKSTEMLVNQFLGALQRKR
jgi:hypothetical protein